MSAEERCPECGSWDTECMSDKPVPGCGCARCLSAALAQANRERDEAQAEVAMLKDECASISAEFGLPPTIRPSEGEIRRMLDGWKEARAEVERLRGLVPELPPRAPDGGGLPRYGLYWRGPTDPLSVPMESGYWTPWHLAKEALRLVVERQRQAMIAAINDDSYANYDGAEVVRILKAVPRVTEGEP